jgi:hypothetical protein
MEEASIHSLSNTGSIGAFTNLIDLFVDAATNFKLRSEMLSRKYEGVWNNRWATMRNETVNPLLIPQENCSAFFNCALSYLNDRGHNATVITYLEILAKPPHFNFHAAKAIANNGLNSLNKGKENTPERSQDIIKKSFEYAFIAAEYHHTPGYLLCAHVNFWAAQFLERTDKSLATAHYTLCYKHLLIAQALEPYCADKISSAYCGQGISAGNHWKDDSTQKLIHRLLSFFQDNGLIIATRNAEFSASQVAKEIITLFNDKPLVTESLAGLHNN